MYVLVPIQKILPSPGKSLRTAMVRVAMMFGVPRNSMVITVFVSYLTGGCESEIADFDVIATVQENIRRFQISVKQLNSYS